MTSSSPSPDPIIEAGFAAHEREGDRIPLTGVFNGETPPLRGVFLTDMPVGRPTIARPRVKGVAGPTGGDGDYAPGQGTWSDAT